MAAAEVEALKKIRNALVLARRNLVAKTNGFGQAPDVAELIAATEQLSKLQSGIEAVDRRDANRPGARRCNGWKFVAVLVIGPAPV